MLGTVRRLPGSFFIIASLAIIIGSAIACGGGGGGGDDPPPVTVPTIVSTTPADGADQISTSTSVTIEFSEDMNQASVEAAITVLEDAAPVVPVFNWITGNQLELQLTLAESTNYDITVGTGAQDAEGTALASSATFSFTTGDTPTLTFNSPAASATDVSTAATVSMTFSESMDTSNVEDNLSVSGYLGTVNFAWSGSDTNLVLSFIPVLPDDTTITVTVFTIAQDAEGTPLGTNYSLTFSTGPSIATGAISGTISDDPDSPYDDVIENTIVALFTENVFSETSTNDSEPIGVADVDSLGAYHFSFLEDETYWLIALQDTNGDGTINELQMGDALGVYSSPDVMDSVAVSGATVSGIDFDLYDPEAIAGELFYAGAWTGELGTLENDLVMFAFTGDFAFTGEMYLTNNPDFIGTSADPEINYFNDSGTNWIYFLNPFFEPDLSVSGSLDGSVVPASRDYIPAGSYKVLATVEIPGGDEAIGFAESSASIAGTGDDAVGTDIVLYDTTTVSGRVELVTSTGDGGSSYYEDAAVSILGWPLMEVPSNASKVGTGGFVFGNAPLGPMVALHGEPGASEAADYLAFNSQYKILDPLEDNTDYNISIVSKTVAEQFASLCGVTINYNLATVGGNANYNDGGDGAAIVGAEILISSGNDVHYLSSDFSSCSTAGPTDNVDEGPQFFIFNVPIPADNTATIAASDSTYPVGSISIPLAAGELTFADLYNDD